MNLKGLAKSKYLIYTPESNIHVLCNYSSIALYVRKSITTADDLSKNKMATLKILKYIGIKHIKIFKRKCHAEMHLVFLEVILKLYDVCFMKNISIAPCTCLHRFDIHIIIR